MTCTSPADVGLPGIHAASEAKADSCSCLQMKAVVKELGPSIGQLLSQQRAGVVAALLAAAGRTGACQDAVLQGLNTGLRACQDTAKVCCLHAQDGRQDRTGQGLLDV